MQIKIGSRYVGATRWADQPQPCTSSGGLLAWLAGWLGWLVRRWFLRGFPEKEIQVSLNVMDNTAQSRLFVVRRDKSGMYLFP